MSPYLLSCNGPLKLQTAQARNRCCCCASQRRHKVRDSPGPTLQPRPSSSPPGRRGPNAAASFLFAPVTHAFSRVSASFPLRAALWLRPCKKMSPERLSNCRSGALTELKQQGHRCRESFMVCCNTTLVRRDYRNPDNQKKTFKHRRTSHEKPRNVIPS